LEPRNKAIGPPISVHDHDSLVKIYVSRRIPGAAKSTTGNITIQAISQDFDQCTMKLPSVRNGKLAVAAAIAQVRPD
jgi:hypothetical protein